MPEIPETQLAYIAGLVDGEGCISIDKSATGVRRYASPGAGLILRVRIYNCSKPMIDFVNQVWPGYVRKITWKSNPKHLDAYSWELLGKRAAIFLNTILPFLITKYDEANALIVFGETLDASWKCSSDSGGGLQLTPEAVRLRRLAVTALRYAKSRNSMRKSQSWSLEEVITRVKANWPPPSTCV